MKLYQKILATGALIGAIGLAGCEQPKPQTLEGTVKEEFGTASRIVESSGAIFGNESVKFGDPTYGLILEANDGTYTINIKDYWKKPVIALAKAIEPGDRVRVTYDNWATTIGNDKVGTTPSTTVDIIEKAK